MSAVDALFEALRGIPPLPGALCRGQHELFDDADLPNRALALCARCPALAGCSTWFEALPPKHRPPGVIAGRVNSPKDATA